MIQGLTIHPLHLGNGGIEKSLVTFRSNYGLNSGGVFIGWVIKGGEKNVLVDTGPSSLEHAVKYHWPITKNASHEIDQALNTVGLKCTDIGKIILTHLHWDHCHNLQCFPGAEIYVQKAELHYAVAPLPHDRRPYEIGLAPDVRPPWMNVLDRLISIEGEVEVISGVRTIKLPGHTPGSQGVIVDTRDGAWVIAGDTVPLYDNLQGNDVYPIIPSGLYQNMFDYRESLLRLEPYKGKILPGHDPKVFKQKSYPLI